MSETEPKGPFTVWVDHGYEGWSPTDYPTLEAALTADKYGSRWTVMKPVTFVIAERMSEDELLKGLESMVPTP